ncbi:hypothetical protein [Kribbella sp. VKM Ac-2568]|uniref:hypothetical protein n=1 Tax=Kribbella sp. VKM Ac-2568 TaxID=2512219 RepID=UPI0010491767|nr:hypothetical protein [Kribbella sp. VKM Ac-2568]
MKISNALRVRRARVARWTAAIAAAGALVLTPIAAVATGLDDDPAPSGWPSVAEPADSNSTVSDPRPTNPPTVAKPPEGEASDPTVLSWPGPQQQ